MYGGLFGDLPATKQDANGDQELPPSQDTVDDASTAVSATAVGVVPHAVPRPDTATPRTAVTTLVPRVASHWRPRAVSQKRASSDAVSAASQTAPWATVARSVPRPSVVPPLDPATLVAPTAFMETEIPASPDTESLCRESHPHDTVRDTQSRNDVTMELYDPLVPNDVLLYWQHVAAVQERQRWEQVRHAKVQEERELYAQLQQEQRTTAFEVSTPTASNDGAHRRAHVGRGRGGLSNLPAWLVQKEANQR